MRYFKLISSLALASVCLLGCDDDSDTHKKKQNNDNNTSGGNSEIVEPTIKTCTPNTYIESCTTDPDIADTDIKVSCGKSNEADVDHIKKEACPKGSKCSVLNNKAICIYDEVCQEENAIVDSKCAFNSYNDIELVKYTCVRFNDNSLHSVESREKCDGLCQNGHCYQVGDDCDWDLSTPDSVLGCNGSDYYVCGKFDKTIHREWCPNDGLCQKSSDGYYYCAAKCDTKGSSSSTCTITDERAIRRTCQSVNGSQQLYLVADDSVKTTGSKTQYCKNGSLNKYPTSGGWQGQCTEYCYGNSGNSWIRDGGHTFRYTNCGVGKCGLQSGSTPSYYCELSYCMQPCDNEGDILVMEGNTITNTPCSTISYKCTKYSVGLYYKAIVETQCY